MSGTPGQEIQKAEGFLGNWAWNTWYFFQAFFTTQYKKNVKAYVFLQRI